MESQLRFRNYRTSSSIHMDGDDNDEYIPMLDDVLRKSRQWKSWTVYVLVWSVVCLTIMLGIFFAVILYNSPLIKKSGLEMDEMINIMKGMDNLTNSLSHAINLDDPATQASINRAFLDILDIITNIHTLSTQISATVQQSVAQVEELNKFMESVDYQDIYAKVQSLSDKLNAMLQHFDQEGIKFVIK